MSRMNKQIKMLDFNNRQKRNWIFAILFIFVGINNRYGLLGIFGISSLVNLVLSISLCTVVSAFTIYFIWFRAGRASLYVRITVSFFAALYIWLSIFIIAARLLMLILLILILMNVTSILVIFKRAHLEDHYPICELSMLGICFIIWLFMLFEYISYHESLVNTFNSMILYLSVLIGALSCAISFPFLKKSVPDARSKKKQKKQKKQKGALPLSLIAVFLSATVLSYPLISGINVSLDFSKPETHTVKIENVRSSGGYGKNSIRRYKIEVELLGEDLWINVPYDFYSECETGNLVNVNVCRGALGEAYAVIADIDK